MHAHGLLPGRIETDTKGFVRFSAPGDTGKRQNGFYKLVLGRWPVGWFGDWKQNLNEQWSWHEHTKQELSDTERAAIKRELRARKAEADQEREAKQAEVAEDASKIWKDCNSDLLGGHPYLERKGIEDPRSLRGFLNDDIYPWDAGERLVVVPMLSFDRDGKAQLTNLQFIGTDGEKRFMTGGRVDGCFFTLSGSAEVTVLCEGVATAFAIWRATGATVTAAFNSGNLVPVVREYRRNRPAANLLIAGDDDVLPSAKWLKVQEDRDNGFQRLLALTLW
jgi:putative DNA primase/helicase